jgi:hypothetical protein
MDEIARRRTLLILSVLSGETTVSDAIETAQISRGTYYKLEQRALEAMVASMIPGAEDGQSQALTRQKRIEQLQGKIRRLEQERRRRDKLESLTTKILGTGTVKTSRGGRPRKKTSTRTRGGAAGA